VVAGAVVLELGSLFMKRYFNIALSGGTVTVQAAAATTEIAETQPTSGSVPTNPSSPSGLLTSAQLEEILGYNP
jgi:hypothetical protein